TVQWSGYFGGEGNDNLTQVKVGEDGSIYCAGITRSTTGIASPGAHQQNLGGTQNYDAMLVKFSPDGTRVWSTYYGGNKSEAQSTMVIMGDYILLNGATFSTDN